MEVVGTYPGAERAERAERHGADQGRGDEVSHLRPPPGRTSLTPGLVYSHAPGPRPHL